MQNSFAYRISLRFRPTFQILQIGIQAIRSQSSDRPPRQICLEHLRSVLLSWLLSVDFPRQLHYRLRQTSFELALPVSTVFHKTEHAKRKAQPDHQQKQCKIFDFLHSYSIVVVLFLHESGIK